MGVGDVVKVVSQLHSVVLVQTIFGRNPQITVTVLHDIAYQSARQSFVGRKQLVEL